MYKNKFTVIIKKDGQPLRELSGRDVYIPFNSEYSIELKNGHSRPATAKITIDGADIFGGDSIIIPAYGSSTVERFMSNGNLSVGRKLKFVKVSSSGVADPTSPENGLVEVTFQLEKKVEPLKIQYIPFIPPKWDNEHNIPFKYEYTSTCDTYIGTPEQRKSLRCASVRPDSALSFSANYMKRMDDSSGVSEQACMSLSSDKGATIEGEVSAQKFCYGHIGVLEEQTTIIKIWLRGLDSAITTSDTLHCINCGKKIKHEFNFCPKCGKGVEIS